MGTYPVVIDLPSEYLTGIGRVASTFAFLETELRNTSFAALKLSPKHGRTAVRTPRMHETVAMIRELLSLDAIHVKTDLKKLEKLVERLEKARDVVCHCIWIEGPDGKPWLQDLTGTWQPDPKAPPVRRRAHPEGIRINLSAFEEMAKLNVAAAAMTAKLRGEIQEAHKQASP